MERYRRIGLAILILLTSTSGVVACSGYTLFGSLAGGGLALVTVAFWLLTATTQSGCVQSCLSVLTPQDAGDASVCLSIAPDVGPCLSLDGSSPDRPEVGPCLGMPYDAGDGGDAEVGPCLSPPPPDASDEDAGSEDIEIGPCLSIAPPDASEEPDAGETPDVAAAPRPKHPALARRDAVARLAERGVLPADVAARLRAVEDEEA